jgi:hypothetical protein
VTEPEATPPPLPNPRLVVGDPEPARDLRVRGEQSNQRRERPTTKAAPVSYEIVGANRTFTMRAGERLTFRLSRCAPASD